MELKELYQNATAKLGSHSESGMLHGEAEHVKAFMAGLVDRVESVAHAAEAGVSEGVVDTLDEIKGAFSRLVAVVDGLLQRVTALENVKPAEPAPPGGHEEESDGSAV